LPFLFYAGFLFYAARPGGRAALLAFFFVPSECLALLVFFSLPSGKKEKGRAQSF
jgi:hypothetical protein